MTVFALPNFRGGGWTVTWQSFTSIGRRSSEISRWKRKEKKKKKHLQ